MKKRRLKKWLIGIGCFLVILLAGAYFGINYAADKVMDKLSDSILESAMASPDTLGEREQSSMMPSGSPNSPTSAEGTEQRDPDQPKQNVSGTVGNRATGSVSTSTTSVSGSPTNNPDDVSSHSYSAEVSVDKAATVKDEITFSEKTKLMTIMLKRLNADDIKTLSDLAGGGLSVEKKKEAKKIILEKLSEKEYDELIKIAQKYGLSQGKSYGDSKQEKGMQE